MRCGDCHEGRGVEDDRLEVVLQSALFVPLATAGVWTLAEFGGQSLQALALVSSARPIAGWGAAILACLALSSLLERWRRRLGDSE